MSLGSDKGVGSDKNIRNSDHGALFTALLNHCLCELLVATSLDYFVFDLKTDHGGFLDIPRMI